MGRVPGKTPHPRAAWRNAAYWGASSSWSPATETSAERSRCTAQRIRSQPAAKRGRVPPARVWPAPRTLNELTRKVATRGTPRTGRDRGVGAGPDRVGAGRPGPVGAASGPAHGRATSSAAADGEQHEREDGSGHARPPACPSRGSSGPGWTREGASGRRRHGRVEA